MKIIIFNNVYLKCANKEFDCASTRCDERNKRMRFVRRVHDAIINSALPFLLSINQDNEPSIDSTATVA